MSWIVLLLLRSHKRCKDVQILDASNQTKNSIWAAWRRLGGVARANRALQSPRYKERMWCSLAADLHSKFLVESDLHAFEGGICELNFLLNLQDLWQSTVDKSEWSRSATYAIVSPSRANASPECHKKLRSSRSRHELVQNGWRKSALHGRSWNSVLCMFMLVFLRANLTQTPVVSAF